MSTSWLLMTPSSWMCAAWSRRIVALSLTLLRLTMASRLPTVISMIRIVLFPRILALTPSFIAVDSPVV